MQLINLTPHDIMIGHMEDNQFCLDRTIQNKDNTIARVTSAATPCAPIDCVAVRAIQFLKVEGLPEPKEGVRYIVSMPVAQFAKDRDDLISPYSEKAFREGAKILGVPGFVHYDPVATEAIAPEKTSTVFKRFVNVSFQPVTIDTAGVRREIPKSDRVATVKTIATPGDALDGIPFFSIKFLGVQDLPPEEEGVIYIVPMPVAQVAGRSDLYVADTEQAIREKGNIVAVPGLVRYL